MRARCRIVRRLHPLVDTLESLAPVSSLVPGLPATAPTMTIGRIAPGNLREGAPPSGSTHEAPPGTDQPVPPTPRAELAPISQVYSVTAGVSDSQELPSAAASQPQSTETVPVPTPDSSSFTPFSTTTLSPSSRASSNPLPRPSGPILNSAQQPAAPQGAPAPSTAATAPAIAGAAGSGLRPTAPASSPIPIAASGPDRSGIRPMTMAPAQGGTVRAGGGHTSGLLSPDMGSGGSGGNDLPPNLTSYTFGIDEPDPQNQPGQYQADGLIPIGASAALDATSPYGEENPITSWSWSGGTAFGSYCSKPANQTPPPSQAAPTPPAANGEAYGFIVGPQPGQYYEVTCTVNYQGGGSGTATLTFSSVAPTGSLSVKQTGNVVTFRGVPPDTNLGAQIDPDVQIQGTASLGNAPAGQFMFMQIINSIGIDYHDANGAPWSMANNASYADGAFNGPLLDPTPGNPPEFAQEFTYTTSQGQTIVGNTSWRLPDQNGNTTFPAGGATGYFIADTPYFSTPAGAQDMSVSESFSDYLMYQANMQGSVWIAVSEMDWSWSASVSQGPPGIASSNPQPAPTGPITPSGAAAFPWWVNTGTNLLATGPEEGD